MGPVPLPADTSYFHRLGVGLTSAKTGFLPRHHLPRSLPSANTPVGGIPSSGGIWTLRYYEPRGLSAEPDRSLGRHRQYSRQAVTVLWVIEAAQRLGFALDEVADLRGHSTRPPPRRCRVAGPRRRRARRGRRRTHRGA
ncbi:MerR family transcriptional regulator [Nocardia sp. NBC_01329]|uniref:MerR family transcriptional regulator n=1 Tax=Nocardia sp. NBC_01329 TaxID=2903594 RepID=UPI002E0FA005|nr:MerR family transcriptional regulator [Nocardia sp. NBC_01329]